METADVVKELNTMKLRQQMVDNGSLRVVENVNKLDVVDDVPCENFLGLHLGEDYTEFRDHLPVFDLQRRNDGGLPATLDGDCSNQIMIKVVIEATQAIRRQCKFRRRLFAAGQEHHHDCAKQ